MNFRGLQRREAGGTTPRTVWFCRIPAADDRRSPVAQTSKSAVSPISQSADAPLVQQASLLGPAAGLETCDTADLEVCATGDSRKWRCIPVLALLAVGVAGCATNRATDENTSLAVPQSYMRVARPNSDTVALQIALRRFTPRTGRGPVIWLAGASHVGDSNYYARLQKMLDAQPLVLFEGVGARAKAKFDPQEEASIQHTLATSLGLVFQLSAFDYDRPHYRNSDLTIAQLQQLLLRGAGRENGEASNQASQEFQQLLQVMDGSSLLGTLVHVGLKFIGSSPKLQSMVKVVLIETLGQIEGDMSQIKGVPPEIQQLLAVIILERNKVVIQDLQNELANSRPPPSIAVFYGAGHMADLEKRLRNDLKYRPRDEIWLTALSVNTRAAGLSPAELEAMRSLIQWQLDALRP
jgi:hypothetical protein